MQKDHPLQNTYRSMVGRCRNRTSKAAKNYAEKGIFVCARWLVRKQGFENFVTDMGPKPTPKHTLERKDSNGPYSPENCCWATRREQMLNTSRTHKIVDDGGIEHTTIELAERYGISPALLGLRHNQGKTFAEIISTHHLQPGYSHIRDAIETAAAMNRAMTHCRRGHELSGDNLTIRANGQRICRACGALAQKRYRAKQIS